MICKYFPLIVILAISVSFVASDTRSLFQQPEVREAKEDSSNDDYSDNYYGLQFTPRFDLSALNPFQYISFETVIRPLVTLVGAIVGYFGFTQMTNWLSEMVGVSQNKKSQEKISTSAQVKFYQRHDATNNIEINNCMFLINLEHRKGPNIHRGGPSQVQ